MNLRSRAASVADETGATGWSRKVSPLSELEPPGELAATAGVVGGPPSR